MGKNQVLFLSQMEESKMAKQVHTLHLAGEPSAALGTAKLNIVNQPGAALPLPVEIVDKVVNSP